MSSTQATATSIRYLLFDERDPEQIKRVMAASDEILNRCIDLGGSVTGEHGIGVEKISFMSRLFTERRPGDHGAHPHRDESDRVL
jgi:FAD/FMN-containing dehydrogenase